MTIHSFWNKWYITINFVINFLSVFLIGYVNSLAGYWTHIPITYVTLVTLFNNIDVECTVHVIFSHFNFHCVLCSILCLLTPPDEISLYYNLFYIWVCILKLKSFKDWVFHLFMRFIYMYYLRKIVCQILVIFWIYELLTLHDILMRNIRIHLAEFEFYRG